MKWFARKAGLICPICEALQPAFAIMSTAPRGAVNARLNDVAPCPECKTPLKLVPKVQFAQRATTGVVGIFYALSTMAFFMAIVVMVAHFFGFVGALVVTLFWVPFQMIVGGAYRAAALKRTWKVVKA